MPRSQRIAGFSLLELLLTLMLAALVFGLGLPSFAAFAADARLRKETDALFHAVHLARKASIVRRRVVTLCASIDGRTCDPAGRWSAGWIMFENLGRRATGVRSDQEELLQFHDVDEQVELQANRRSFSFRSTHLRATNGTIMACDRLDRAATRALVVSYTGRPRVARRTRNGDAYACAD